MKKVSLIVSIYFIFVFLNVSNVTANKNTDLTNKESLHPKSEVSRLALDNMRHNYLDREPVRAKKKMTEDKFLDNNLLFKSFFSSNKWFNDLLIQFENYETANKFKSKNVDIYGLEYSLNCYGGEENKTACTYGGVTLHDGNKLESEKQIPINLWIDGTQKKVPLDKVKTNKREVTVQELDAQARLFLQKDLNLYNTDKLGGEIQKGIIVFHTSDNNEIAYDLFDINGEHPEKQLKIYKDNKTVSSQNLHIDIYLYKDKE
ncbi:exotoxin beta-grasp domain-containing protein [Staphylococcus chromogenes]|uniref:exotoxin beta-grasp domain-containing protein n=1 Tax=Staphylococcus chromogenes TaxID=46126 RepID=UPI003EBD94FD